MPRVAAFGYSTFLRTARAPCARRGARCSARPVQRVMPLLPITPEVAAATIRLSLEQPPVPESGRSRQPHQTAASSAIPTRVGMADNPKE